MNKHSKINQLVEQLYRHESGKMVAVLTRIFGSENLDLAEDVVQDAIVEAIKDWTKKGIPVNPAAWLYKVAKNKALNIINREKYKRKYTSDILHFLKSPWTAEPAIEYLFSEQEIIDDQLRMMFTCCHPSISADSQIALILKTLCGFNIAEISRAFLTTKENANKRLVRARKKIRNANIPFEVPHAGLLQPRLEVVLGAINLLFNEGYNASAGEDLIRFELCEEAIRLADIIISHSSIKNKSDVYALLALMQFNVSRFKARQDENGNILTLEKQDRSLWDSQLIKKGLVNLERSAFNKEIAVYHIMASISGIHCLAKDFKSTDWEAILLLYNKLIQIENSPIILLNRAIVLAKIKGPEIAVSELEKIKNDPAINSYYLFYSTQAEFYIQAKEFIKAANSLKKAIGLTSLKAEKKLLTNRLALCEKK